MQVGNLSPRLTNSVHKFQSLFKISNTNIFIKKNMILNDLNLDINPADFIFLTGKTGAGKTTFLNFLWGKSKNLKISGEVIRPGDHCFIAKVFQDLRVFNNETIIENLFYAYDEFIYGSEENFKKEIYHYAKILEITKHLESKLSECSGGICQKVAILRAILSRADIILLDEPTSSLDHDSSMIIYDLLKILNKKNKVTIIWATHDSELVRKLSGKILHIKNKRILDTGNTCFI